MASQNDRLTLQETDETKNITATYVFSGQDDSKSSQGGRVDVMNPPPKGSWVSQPFIDYLADVFLPSGYPQSVSDDYLSYQIYDSLQAFCSSIAGLLSSRAVLQGVGVGNADASPTSALLLHILQDSSGRVATILFAHRVGTALEPECKTYRLAADVFNDIAMILDCLSPMIPAGGPRVGVLSAAGVLRALCGVAGGSSKASLSAHFAKWGNLAELNAKDSSQETVVSLVGMLVGSLVVSHITGFKTTWAALLTLLTFHLTTNYLAVRSVQMTSLNRQRTNIVFTSLLESDPDLNIYSLRPSEPSPRKPSPHPNSHLWRKPPSPSLVASQEHIFQLSPSLVWASRSPDKFQPLGSADIGASLSSFFQKARSCPSFRTPLPLQKLNVLFAAESYIIFLFPRTRDRMTKWHASILLKDSETEVQGRIKAWVHALLAARVLAGSALAGDGVADVLTVLGRSLKFLNAGGRYEKYCEELGKCGWDLGVWALETKAGRRVNIV